MDYEWLRQFLEEKNIFIEYSESQSLSNNYYDGLMIGFWYYLLTRDKNQDRKKFKYCNHAEGLEDQTNIYMTNLWYPFSRKSKTASHMKLVENFLRIATGINVIEVMQETSEETSSCCIQILHPEEVLPATRTLSYSMLMFPKFYPFEIDIQQNPEKLQMINKLKSFIDAHSNGRTLTNDILLAWLIEQAADEVRKARDVMNRKNFLTCMQYQQEKLLTKVQNRLRTTADECEIALRRYQELVQQRNEIEYEYEALVCRGIDSNLNEDLYNLLFNNNNIVEVEIKNDMITYGVKTILSNYDIDAYENKTLAERGVNLAILADVKDKTKLLALLNAIFKNDRYRIQVFNRFSLKMGKIATINLDRLELSRTGLLLNDNTFAHPHGQGFGCTGNFSVAWSEALEAGNIMAAVNYTIAYTQHHNWHDMVVSGYFVKQIEEHMSHHFIKDLVEDKFVSPKEILKTLGE